MDVSLKSLELLIRGRFNTNHAAVHEGNTSCAVMPYYSLTTFEA
jgi:hypothetical protein